MNLKTLLLLPIICLFSCNSQTGLPLWNAFKPADTFARGYIDKMIRGQTDSCIAEYDPGLITDEIKNGIITSARRLQGENIIKYKIVEETCTFALTGSGKETQYRLAYEYDLSSGYILVRMILKEKNGKMFLSRLDGNNLAAPLDELNKFRFWGRSSLQYTFLAFAILIPLFIFTTFVIMLFSKMKRKKKVLWTFIILLVALPKFLINWNTGQTEFHLLSINLPAGGVTRTTLYSDWVVFFLLPIGAIIYWIRRKRLITDQLIVSESQHEDLETSTEETRLEDSNSESV